MVFWRLLPEQRCSFYLEALLMHRDWNLLLSLPFIFFLFFSVLTPLLFLSSSLFLPFQSLFHFCSIFSLLLAQGSFLVILGPRIESGLIHWRPVLYCLSKPILNILRRRVWRPSCLWILNSQIGSEDYFFVQISLRSICIMYDL